MQIKHTIATKRIISTEESSLAFRSYSDAGRTAAPRAALLGIFGGITGDILLRMGEFAPNRKGYDDATLARWRKAIITEEACSYDAAIDRLSRLFPGMSDEIELLKKKRPYATAGKGLTYIL